VAFPSRAETLCARRLSYSQGAHVSVTAAIRFQAKTLPKVKPTDCVRLEGGCQVLLGDRVSVFPSTSMKKPKSEARQAPFLL